MPSSLFLAVTAIAAIISIFSALISIYKEGGRVYKKNRKGTISLVYLVGSILVTTVIVGGLITLSNYLVDATSSREYTVQRIEQLEENISYLENVISSLQQENQHLEAMISSLKEGNEINLKKYHVIFDASNYDGLITPDYSVDGETKIISIMLDPADGYYIECLDLNANKIEPYSTEDNKWSFIMPDSDITIHIRKK